MKTTHSPESESVNPKESPEPLLTADKRILRVNGLNEQRAVLQAVTWGNVTSTNNEYERFKIEAGNARALNAVRNEAVAILSETPGVAQALVLNNAHYTGLVDQYGNDWRSVSKDTKALSVINNSRMIEHAVLDGDSRVIIPGGMFQVADIDIAKPKKDPLTETDALIARLTARNTVRSTERERVKVPSLVTSETKVNTFIAPKKEPKVDFLTVSKESLRGVEKSMEVLEKRKTAVTKRLMEKGLNGLQSGLEAYKNISPKKKAVIGLLFAGASLATGGMTSFLSKGLSTLSFASSHYHEKLKAMEENGTEIDKRKLVVQSLTRGLILSLASSELMSIMSHHVHLGDIAHSISEKVGGLKNSIKEWMSGLVTSVDTGTATVPSMDNAVFPPEVVLDADSVVEGEELVASEVSPSTALERLEPLSDYTIRPGDNLTKIIREQILPTIPGIEDLTDFQKNSLIENYIKEARKYPSISFFDSINQFSSEHSINSGKNLELEKMRRGMISFKFPGMGGDETIFSHVKAATSGSMYSAYSPAVDTYPATDTGTIPASGAYETYESTQNIDDENQVEDLVDTNTEVPHDDSGDNSRIQGLGYRNNA